MEQLREQARGGEPERAAELLRSALGLWRGDPLADFGYDSFARLEIERLQELRLAVLEERIDVDLALGWHADLVPELETLVARHPLRERLRARLMLALYRCGRQAEALEAYREGRRVLNEELGLDPSRQLQELERAILTQGSGARRARRAADRPAAAAPVGALARRRWRGGRRPPCAEAAKHQREGPAFAGPSRPSWARFAFVHFIGEAFGGFFLRPSRWSFDLLTICAPRIAIVARLPARGVRDCPDSHS